LHDLGLPFEDPVEEEALLLDGSQSFPALETVLSEDDVEILDFVKGLNLTRSLF